MPEDEDAVFLPTLGSFAYEMQRIDAEMRRVSEEISRSLGIPFEVAVRHLETAMRSSMPEEFPNPYFSSPFRITRRVNPYPRADFEIDPAASQESTVDPGLLNRVRTLRPPLTHDLRPATGRCLIFVNDHRCNEPVIARCFTIGCIFSGINMCAKHLHEQHDGKTLPEGVPHDI